MLIPKKDYDSNDINCFWLFLSIAVYPNSFISKARYPYDYVFHTPTEIDTAKIIFYDDEDGVGKMNYYNLSNITNDYVKMFIVLINEPREKVSMKILPKEMFRFVLINTIYKNGKVPCIQLTSLYNYKKSDEKK